MASNMLSPGVQVNIQDFSDYIAETSSSVIGLVGGARRGPTEPTLITTRDDALKIFGDPTTEDFGIYSLLAALEHADAVYYKRVMKASAKALAGDPDKNSLLFYGIDTTDTLNGTKISVTGTDSSFTVTITPPDGSSYKSETYANCTKSDVTTKINGVSKLVTVSINEIEGKSFTAIGNYELTGGSEGYSFATSKVKGVSDSTSVPISFASKYADSTLNQYIVKLSGKDFLGYFDYTLCKPDGTVVEELNQLSDDPDDDRYIETYVNNNSSYLTCTYNRGVSYDFPTDGITFDLYGGRDGIKNLEASEIINGLAEFDNPETIEVDVLAAPGWSDASVITKGIKVCETRQDCIFLIDPPFGLKAQQVVDWSNCQGDYKRPDSSIYDSSYAAVYWPWVKVYDTFTADYLWLPPSGYVASQYAYSDEQSEPWYAPAGINRGALTTPVDIEYSPTKGERDLLYGKSNVVNPIINLRSNGLVIWGQKTTQRKSSALNRVNVRRLVNYLKRVITASTNYFLFDPNDETAWDKWVSMVEPVLSSVKSRRGIYEYKIIMDSSTVTEDDISNNRMPGTIKFKPTKTSEFIPLNFMIMPYGASFDEESEI